MAIGPAFKIIVQIGKKFFGTNSKRVADQLKKQGGKVVSKNKVPSSATISRAPTSPNPRSSTGKFTEFKPPVKSRSTSPTTTKRPPKPAVPKADSMPSVNTTSARPSRDRIVGVSNKPAAIRASTLATEDDQKPKKETTTTTKPSKAGSSDPRGKDQVKAARPNTRVKTATPSKNTSNNTSNKSKTASTNKGTMTLREYLNSEIKRRKSTISEEKKDASKYKSIAAAKRAKSLYYKDPKSGKTMAAVYKEDLKK